ncbi:Surfeit locus 1 family protein [Sphingomonas panacis]|uniref:SURF1-like protein n=1 Tax=Sphingomonas panacis TaxID=1560345 RepID=A0A1B3Z8C2_9SPHN|nr:SURF1 family protein [Sphingomonas panacis]AOH83672.1 Surfeit locus 1 family protein [Sphingomonas panacis]
MASGGAPERPPRSPATLILLGSVAALLFAALIALGIWQVERRAWKHALIAQVDARLHAAPVAPPGPAEWPRVTAQDAYRRVALTGTYLPGRETFVKAVTERGPGYWALSPLVTDRGFVVLVNRGFVARAAAPVPPGPVRVAGLLRLSEPGGAFLRKNDPAGNHWFSRDVAAIAQARHLNRIAPYFVDADAASSPPGGPVGGLTVVAFSDNHWIYALTWFGLALLVVIGVGIVAREERRVRRAAAGR